MLIRKIKRYGWRKDSLDHRDIRMDLTRVNIVQPPAKADLRSTQHLPPVYDQGQLGSCTANAIAAAVDFQRHKSGRPFMTPSRLFIYYGERVIEGDPGTDGGAEIRDGMKVISKQGVCPEQEWPYRILDFAVKPDAIAYTEAMNHKTLKYISIPQSSPHLEQALGVWNSPVVIGFSVFDAMESDAVATSGVLPLPGPNDAPIGGHAVCLVGYDRDKGVFIARNSWGSSWGQQGYFTMPYAYVLDQNLASDFWTVNSVAA